MKLVNYVSETGVRAGVVKGDSVLDLESLGREVGISNDADLRDVDSVLSSGALDDLRNVENMLDGKGGKPLSTTKLLSPILRPEKIYCVALNYVSHTDEGKVKPPSEPYFFTKFRNAIVGPQEEILVPKVSQKADWEVELAVVIGKEGKYIPKEKAMDHVAGYSVANDVSFRDLQFPPGWPGKLNPLGQNWVRGKGLDSAFPLGPWLVTKDEVKDPQKLKISLKVNGEVVQDSTTAEMIFKIDALIEYLSAGITLKPGDVISTGTPMGVAVFNRKSFLKQGDILEGTISEIGTLTNRVRAE